MGIAAWLRRWDEHNQAVLSGEIPQALRDQWRWTRSQDEHGAPRLQLQRVVLDSTGVRSDRWLRRSWWSWDQVAVLTWENGGMTYGMLDRRGGGVLSVCLRGDRRVRSLAFWHPDHRVCMALLDDCQAFVEAHGARVRSTIDPAAGMWWAGEPESGS